MLKIMLYLVLTLINISLTFSKIIELKRIENIDIIDKNVTNLNNGTYYFDYEKCVKGICENLSSKYPYYNSMVFYESNAHSYDLHGVVHDGFENCNGYAYHVWAFECGWFENLGSTGLSYWCYNGSTAKNSAGDYITFYKLKESSTKCI